MSNASAFFRRPAAIGVFLGILLLVLWLVPPVGEVIPNAVELQEWLRKPVFDGWLPSATRSEAIFWLALAIALFVASWNCTDAFLDFNYQRAKRPQDHGDYLAARANFRRESYRVWRCSSMFLLACALMFNWPLSTLYVTFGLLVFAYSEAVNSSLDRLYRLSAQDAFRQEREKRRRALEMARSQRNRAVSAEAEVTELQEAQDG